MKALGRTAVVCFLVIFALGVVSAMIKKTRMREEHRHAIYRKGRDHPIHHTVKKILPESRREDYAFGKSFAKSRSKWNKIRHRRHRSGKRKFGGINWYNGDEDKGSWWTGANVCIRNETHEDVDKSEVGYNGSQVDDGNSGTEGDGNDTFRKTDFQSSLMSSNCEYTGKAYKCTNVRGKNGKLVTSVKIYECCPGYDRKSDKKGCVKAYDVTDMGSTFERLDLTKMAMKLKKSGLTLTDLDGQNYTIFAPTNDAFDNVTIQDKDVSIMGHVVKGVYHTIDLDDEQLLETEAPPTAIRINTYNTGADSLVTANCVPMVVKDMVATNGIVHTVQNLLPTVKKSLDQIVLDSPQLTQLSKVIGQLQLNEHGNYTLFAPTDSAFQNLKPNLKDKIFKGQQCGIEFLRQHLLPNVVCSAVVETQALTRNVLHHLINLVRASGNLTANGASVLETDIMATNGVMHTIDRVLIPKNAGDIVDVLDRHETKEFLRLITDAGLTKRLHDLNNFTIFVPTNDALQALPDDISKSSSKNSKDFEKLFNYHVVPQRLSFHNLHDNMELPTLDGNNYIRVNSYQSFPFNSIKTVQCAPVVHSYVDSCEDIVHVVSKVLQPPNGDVLNILKADRNFSSLVALVDLFKLDKLFTAKKLLTFFAPTNKAFDSLSPAAMKNLRQDAKVFTRVVKSHMIAGVLCCSGIFQDTFPFSVPELNLDDGDVSLGNDDSVSFNGVPVILCDQTATNGVVHGIDQFVPEVLTKFGIDRRAKLRRRLGRLLGSDNFRHR